MVAPCCFLLRRLIQLPALLCCGAMVWAVTFLAFPLRVLAAVDRERKLGRLVGEMQAQMDALVWQNKDLDEKLQAALGEHRAMDALLDEMDDEHEGALARIQDLETQLKALRQENMRLNEHKGKSMWDNDKAPAARHGDGGGSKQQASEPVKKPPEGEGPREESAAAAAAEPAVKPAADPASVLALADSRWAAGEHQARAVARRRSLFSLGMSLAVGTVAWSADAPCLPLLAGLFAVVGVSMRTVSRLRRAGDAVPLLSLNWFLLGVLTSPMLPGLAHALVPRAGRLLGPALTWLTAAAPM